MKHTQGPWHIYDMSLPSRKMVIIQPDICQINQKNKRNKYYALNQLDEETQANAHLIAAAPELLEALQYVLAPFIHMAEKLPPEQQEDAKMRIGKALAALQKAEG